MSRRPFDERVQTLTGNQLMFCGTRIDIKGSTVVEGELDLTRGDLKVDGTTEFEEISADNLTTTGNVSTTGNVEAEDVIATRDASVGQDLTVDGNASVAGDLTVLGNLNAALGLPVHVVEDPQTGRTMVAMNHIESSWFVTEAIKTKQNLIDINNPPGFRLLESGCYLIYFYYRMSGSGLTGSIHYITQQGPEIRRYQEETSNGVIEREKIFFVQANANDQIYIYLRHSFGASSVSFNPFNTSMRTRFGVVKLA